MRLSALQIHIPQIGNFIFGIRKKTHKAKSGEYDGR